MALDLSNLTTEDIEQLKGLLSSATGGSRSPIRKPLTDLNPPRSAAPSAKLNRPHFEWSAYDPPEKEKNPGKQLFWDTSGTERLVAAGAEPQSDWTTSPPMAHALSAAERAQKELDSLSPEDRDLVMAAQKQSRMNKLRDMLAGLSEADIASLRPAMPVEVQKAKRSA